MVFQVQQYWDMAVDGIQIILCLLILLFLVRSRRQRKLLMALWEQGLSVGVIPKLPALSSATADTLQTDIPFDQVVALAYKGLQLRPSNILSNSIGPWQVENWTTPQGAATSGAQLAGARSKTRHQPTAKT